MKQVTMISLYGKKDKDLQLLIEDCWERINISKFRRIFEPYNIKQIHGTIIGMAKHIGSSELFNEEIWRDSNTRKKIIMDFTELINIVRDHFPMTVRFGGFDENYRDFQSQNKTPFERSFQVQWDSSKLTLIGWPRKNDKFTEELSKLRNEFKEKCNIKYRYEKDGKDFHMVLGEIKRPHLLTDSELKRLKMETTQLEESIREYLRKHPIDVKINCEQVFLAQYVNETLPLDSTNVYCIQDRVINNPFIQNLYS